MKKQLLALTAALMATAVIAQTPAPAPAAAPAAPAAAPAAPTVDTLTKIRAANKIVMGVRDSSGLLSYALGGGQYGGLHVNLCVDIINELKRKNNMPNLQVEYMSVTSQNRIPLMQNGTIDIECGSTTNNRARQEQVAFAVTTFVTEVRMAVKANSGITSIAQLNGRNVVTTSGTTSVQTLRRHERAGGVDFREVFGKDHAESFLLLESGRADAFVMDDYILAGNIANSRTPADFRVVGEVLNVEPIAIMIRKDDPAFKRAVDDEIRAMFRDGRFTALYNKWFMQPIPPRNQSAGVPMPEALRIVMGNPNDQPMEAYNRR
jgi:glutamate/aspartate transport system substrate-binding protein